MSLAGKLAKLLPEGNLKKFLRTEYRESIIAMRIAKAKAKANGCGLSYNSSDNTCTLRFNTGLLKGFSMVAPKRGAFFVYPASYELPNYFPNTKIEPGTVFVDAGSFPGDFALAAKWLVPGCKVFAFEPDPENRQYLEEVIELNNAIGQVEVLPYALSSSNTVMQMVPKKAGSFLVSGNCPGNNEASFPVRTVTLDSFLPTLLGHSKKVPFIKMDIEGHELEACAGAKETIARGAYFSIACYHIVDGRKTSDYLIPLFHDAGYSMMMSDDIHLTLIALPGRTSGRNA